ncbi:MAG: macro domain-containing protein [Myxococcota bacterium]
MASFLPNRIILVDRTPSLVTAWERCFGEYEHVEIREADFFSEPADAMVSPANSFCIMDGGLDLAIRDILGFEVQRSAQELIVEKHHGELAVGQAEIVQTPHPSWPFLIVAPTMRVPESVARTANAYLAFRAILLATIRFNQTAGDGPRIGSVVCPGLGTGIGAMESERCAVQMRMAYRQVTGPPRIPSFDLIHKVHATLVRA